MDQMMAATPQDDSASQPPSEANMGATDYTVCIRVSGGQFSVGVENEAIKSSPMMNEGMKAEASESDGFIPAESLKEALTIAMEIIRADGKMPGDGGQDSAEFDAGFKSR